MKYKNIIILIIILVTLLAISAVSAAENTTEDIVSADVNEDVVSVGETTENILSVENNNILEKDDFNENLSVENDSNLEKTSNDEVLTSDYISYAQITTNTVTGYAGNYITLKAIVKNDQGIAKKATVEFYFNGQTYKTTTNSYGEAYVNVKCPATEVWDASSKTSGNILTKTTTYKKYYCCDVTVYGTDYYKTTDSFSVISKKPTVVKKYKIIKKKVTRTIKVKNGIKTYKRGNYGVVTYKHKGGYGTMIEVAVGKKNSGLITFYSTFHYKQNGKWKWCKWSKVPKGYSDQFSYGKKIKCDKIKVKYTQVTYKRI